MCFQVLEYMLYYINQTKLAYFFFIMRRKSRGNQSKGARQSSNGQRSNIRSRSSPVNDSQFIFSEIPRAAFMPQSSGDIAFNKIVSSKTNLFQPATSQYDYLQFQQNEQFKSQRFFNDKTSEENSSKREKFWRVLQRNNDDDSLKSSDIDSSCQLQKTSKRFSKQGKSPSRISERMNLQIQRIHSQPEEPTQLYNLQKEEEIVVKKKSNFLFFSKEINFKVTPRKEEIKNEHLKLGQHDPQQKELMIYDQTAQKRVNDPHKKSEKIQKKKPVERKMIKREKQIDSNSYLKYHSLKEAQFLHHSPKYSRNNHYPQRKTRVLPLDYWKGERIVYKNNGQDGVWIYIEKQT